MSLRRLRETALSKTSAQTGGAQNQQDDELPFWRPEAGVEERGGYEYRHRETDR
jgi:hypothetical protein